MNRFLKFQLPAVAWIVLIFWLSSISTFPHVPTFTLEDKAIHVVIFSFLCWLTHRALFHQQRFPWLQERALPAAFLITVAYGYLDEFHQRFVPGRSYDYFDMLADAVGAALYIACFLLVSARARRRKRVAAWPDGQG